jgi:hypothetical protein
MSYASSAMFASVGSSANPSRGLLSNTTALASLVGAPNVVVAAAAMRNETTRAPRVLIQSARSVILFDSYDVPILTIDGMVRASVLIPILIFMGHQTLKSIDRTTASPSTKNTPHVCRKSSKDSSSLNLRVAQGPPCTGS